jgi:hypothetical protein
MKQLLRLTSYICALAVTASATGLLASGQTPAPTRPVIVLPPRVKAPPPPPLPDETSERSLKVDGAVQINLCLTQGSLKVNGWKRDELRVFVANGSPFEIRVRQKSESGEANWVELISARPKGTVGPLPTCLNANEVEIDVPVNASLSVRGQEIIASVDSIRKAKVQNAGGRLTFRNIASGIEASSGQGNIFVESSRGAMTLVSTTGNILAHDAGPVDFADTFTARTNGGAISLQRLEHRQVEARSISGSVAFNGKVLNGASYTINTSRGAIRLTLPQESTFRLSATYAYGSFASDLPVETVTENISPGAVQRIEGLVGRGGDASFRLTTTNGSIVIRKQ